MNYIGIPQRLYRNPTGIPKRLHRNPTEIIQKYHRDYTEIRKCLHTNTKKNLINKDPGVVRRGAHTRGHSTITIVMIRRPTHPSSVFASFSFLVFLVFPPHHYHLLRFLFCFFLVFHDLSFLL